MRACCFPSHRSQCRRSVLTTSRLQVRSAGFHPGVPRTIQPQPAHARSDSRPDSSSSCASSGDLLRHHSPSRWSLALLQRLHARWTSWFPTQAIRHRRTHPSTELRRRRRFEEALQEGTTSSHCSSRVVPLSRSERSFPPDGSEREGAGVEREEEGRSREEEGRGQGEAEGEEGDGGAASASGACDGSASCGECAGETGRDGDGEYTG